MPVPSIWDSISPIKWRVAIGSHDAARRHPALEQAAASKHKQDVSTRKSFYYGAVPAKYKWNISFHNGVVTRDAAIETPPPLPLNIVIASGGQYALDRYVGRYQRY